MTPGKEARGLGRFTLTFIGCGSGIYPELGNNNVLLESLDTGANLLIDCGFVTAPQLDREGRLSRIQNALVTHVHADHVGGFEYWAYLNRYVYMHRPRIYYHEALHDEFWHGSLRGGLAKSQDEKGVPEELTLADYYDPRPVKNDAVIRIDGLPDIRLRPTLHVVGKPSYGIYIGHEIYFSSDTVEAPPSEGPSGQPLRAIFQDCQLFEGPSNVHISISRLEREVPAELKPRVHLMHYGRGHESFRPEAMGFAGFVRPNQSFDF